MINIKGTIKLETVWCKEGLMQSDHKLEEPSLGSLSLRSMDGQYLDLVTSCT